MLHHLYDQKDMLNFSTFIGKCFIEKNNIFSLFFAAYKGTRSRLGEVCLEFLLLRNFTHKQYKVISTQDSHLIIINRGMHGRTR